MIYEETNPSIWRLHGAVYAKFRNWDKEGRILPKYKHGYGHDYLEALEIDPLRYDILKAIDGPHGWAVYQAILAQRGLK